MYLVTGILVSLPFLCIITLLLSSADQVFGQVISDGFNNFFSSWFGNLGTLFQGVLIFLFVSIFTLVFLIYTYLSRNPEKSADAIENKNFNWIISSVVLNNINIVFLIFIIIQFVYLFGGQENIESRELTYSEHARKGFFELQFISLIMVFLLYFVIRFTKENSILSMLLLRFSTVLSAIMTLVIIFSAYTRMNLYEEAYGYTLMRFYPHMVIFIEGFLFIFLLFVNFRKRLFKYFSLYTLTVSGAFVIGMSFLNPVDFVISRNLQMENPDIEYIKTFGTENYLYSVDSKELIYNCENYYFFSNIEEDDRIRGLNLVRETGIQRSKDVMDEQFWNTCNVGR